MTTDLPTPTDRDLCTALDALTSVERHALARSLAEARDDRAERGDQRLAAVYAALAALAAESEAFTAGRLAELERAARWDNDHPLR